MFAKILALDQQISQNLNALFVKSSDILLLKFLTEYLIYLLPIILIALWFWDKNSKKIALKAFFSVVVAWPILANLIGHLVNRARPFEGEGIKELLFHRPTYSFPSDHAAAIFAVFFSLWLSGYRKLSLVILIIGIAISFGRVASGLHFTTDILGGVAVGMLAAWIIDLFDRPLDIVYKLIIRVSRILKLA